MNAEVPEDGSTAWLQHWVIIVAYLVLATLISVPAFSRYTARPISFTLGYIIILTVGGWWLLTIPGTLAKGRKRQRWLWLMLCAALALGNATLYPRTRIPAARSSAPDALIDPARRLLAGMHPYAHVLFDGAPISPGPAWIAVHAPLTALGLIWLVVPVHLGLAAYTLSRFNATYGVIFTVFVLALPAFLQMSFVGHDLFAVGCAMVTITLALYEQASRPGRTLVLWSIAAGVVATARIPLTLFVVALALLAYAKSPRLAGRFIGTAGSVIVATHLAFFLWGYSLGLPYQPLHVFGRAGRAGSAVVPIGVLLSCGVAALVWWRGTKTAADWLCFVWATTGLPFVAIGLGELMNVNRMDWSNWEGKVYVGFGLPLLIAGMLLSRPARVARWGHNPSS